MITESQLRGKLVKLCTAESQSEVARQIGVSRAYINDIVAGKRGISQRVAEYLGYQITTRPVPSERQYKEII